MVNMIRQLASFFRVPERVTLLFTDRGDDTAAPVSPSNPLPVTIQGGSAPGTGGGESEIVAQTFPSLTLTSAFRQGILPPAGANRARLWLTGGTARAGLGGTLAAPLLVRGVPRDLRDAQLQDVRLGIFDGVQDELGNVEPGAVYVEFWRAGPPDPEAALPTLAVGGTLQLTCPDRNSQAACALRSESGVPYQVTVTTVAGGPFVAWLIVGGEPSGAFDLNPEEHQTLDFSGAEAGEEIVLRVAPSPSGQGQGGTVRLDVIAPAVVQVE